MRHGDPGDQRREQHHARELDDDRRRERDAPGGRRGRDDLGDIVDARADPRSELLVVEPERAAQRRQHDDRERSAQRHEGDGERDLVLVGVDDAVRRRDRRDAADREARRDEQREVVRDAEPPAGPARAEERDRRRPRRRPASALKPSARMSGNTRSRPSRTTPSLSTGPAAVRRPGTAAAGTWPTFATSDPERDAEDERRQRRERSMGAQRDGNPGTRESEPGRPPDHSSGWRNG